MVVVNGKEIKLKMDFGAVKILKKEYSIDLFQLGEEYMRDIESLSIIFYVLANRGGSNVTMDDIDSINFSDLDEMVTSLGEVMNDFGPEPSKNEAGGSPLE